MSFKIEMVLNGRSELTKTDQIKIFRVWSASRRLMGSRHRRSVTPCTLLWCSPPPCPPPPPWAGLRCSRQTRPQSFCSRTPRAPPRRPPPTRPALGKRPRSHPWGWRQWRLCWLLMRLSSMIPQGLMTRHHQFPHRVKVSFHEGLSCRIGSDDKRVLRN